MGDICLLKLRLDLFTLDALQAAKELGLALEAAHKLGMPHGAVNPSHVMWTMEHWKLASPSRGVC